MERIAAAHVDSPFEFSFAASPIAARQLVRLEQVTLGYGAADASPPVLADLDWSVLAGDRIGLLGPNGAGKSTLLKAVAGTLAQRRGERLTAQALQIGYFAQHQVEQLRDDESPLWHVARIDPDAREQDLRNFLGGFDFRGDMAAAPVGRFSGGERARLTLALLVRQRPNLLILDEPTNHLDIEMREALAEALQDYDGALIVVAHDRHLLRATTDVLWLVADGRVAPFDGDLDDYRDWVLGARRRAADVQAAASPPPADTAPDRKAQKRAEAESRQRAYALRKPYATKLAKIERALEALGAERTAIEAWLASPEAYVEASKDELRAKLARQVDLGWELARLETEWLELSEALEKLGA
jgi:ATP-binding cassette subfamily F protein 3